MTKLKQLAGYLAARGLAFLKNVEPLRCPRCGKMLQAESVRVHLDGSLRVYHEHPSNGCTMSTMQRDWTE